MTAELVDLLLETTLAISVAASAVLLLRRPFRRLIGARSAYALWLLLPAAGVAVLLPARRVVLELPLDVPVPQATAATLAHAAVEAPFDAAPWLLALWIAGALALALGLTWQQRRFRRALGKLRVRSDGSLQAENADAGPVVIGLWRSRIVLPADFDSRYSELERDLVLRHERAHLLRRDPLANLVAAALRCVYWFNPLLHYAVGRFRFDQELAVDATVLAQRPEARRSYADAMLKTQLMLEQPLLGCHWQSAHPLKERIAMLKHPLPGATRLAAGFALAFALSMTTAYMAWASQPAQTVASEASAEQGVAEVHLIRDGKRVKSARFSGAIGAQLSIADGDLSLRFQFDELAADTVLISGQLTQGAEVLGNPILRIKRGSNGVIGIGEMREDGMPTLGAEYVVPAVPASGNQADQASVVDAAQPAEELSDERRMKPPRYPAGALKRGAQGKVVLNVKIGRDGKALEAELDPEQSTPNIDPELVAAAREAAMNWNFTPGTDDKGEAIESWAAVPVTFSLSEKKEAGQSVESSSLPLPQPPGRLVAAEDASGPLPTYNRIVPPKYPKAAIDEKREGKVLLRVLVGSDGGVQQVEVEASSGSADLDAAAVATLRKWKFNAAHDGYKPVAAWVGVPIDFSLNEGDSAPAAQTSGALDEIYVRPAATQASSPAAWSSPPVGRWLDQLSLPTNANFTLKLTDVSEGGDEC
jgi:bla regulator protein BlaR1